MASSSTSSSSSSALPVDIAASRRISPNSGDESTRDNHSMLFKAYFDSLPASAFLQDLQGKLIYGNAKFHAMAKLQGDASSAKSFISQTTTTAKVKLFPVKNAQGKQIAVGGLLPPPITDDTDHSGLSGSSKETPVSSLANTLLSQMDEESPPLNKKRKMTQQEAPCASRDASVGVKTHERTHETTAATTSSPITIPGEAGYKKLFDNLPMGAIVCEVVTEENTKKPIDWIYREANPAFAKMTGLITEKIIDQRVTHVLHGVENDPADWIGHFGKVGMTGESYHFDQEFAPTMKKWFRGIAYRPDEKEGFFVVLFLDISDAVKAAEDLRESEERHRNLFEKMMQGVVYQDKEGTIISANPSAERILGLTMDQMMGRTNYDSRWKSIYEDGTDMPGHEHPSWIALTTGKPQLGLQMGIFHPATGRHSWLRVDSIPRFRPNEIEPFQVCSTFTDITETKEFEQKLLREKDKAQMADRLKSAFLANMSHEIRTPLNGILGHIDIALSNNLSQVDHKENLEGLRVARQSGELLITIIQDILDLSKIEAGQLQVDLDGDFYVRKLVDQVKHLAETMITQRDKTITFEASVQDGIQDHILGDVFRLQQILNNLVSNAIKFTQTGTVTLSLRRRTEDGMLEFSVKDTGKGIPVEHQESIFEPFRQVEFGDTRKHGGSGLGLTISKKLLALMGGSLWLQSSVVEGNTGTCFFFTFPYRQFRHKDGSASPGPQSIRTEELLECNGGASLQLPSPGCRKILVAEDDRVSRRLVKRMLDISGYESILAVNGAEAVEKYMANKDIGLVLMDVQMPKMDGLSATRKIRELEGDRSILRGALPVPIIALSASAMKGDNEIGLSVGMTDYMTKPVDFNLLKQTIQHHLGPPSSSDTEETGTSSPSSSR